MISNKLTEENYDKKKADVRNSTKVALAFKSYGICYHPKCDQKLVRENVAIGECAHIIPKSLGAVREDWTTPAEERSKLSNLMYMCPGCHAIIDNQELKHQHPASLMREWKKLHEEKDWQQNTASRLVDVQELFKDVYHTQRTLALDIVKGLLEDIRENIRESIFENHNQTIDKIEIILSIHPDEKSRLECEALKAKLFWCHGDIEQAKNAYLLLLQESSDMDIIMDYLNFCTEAPEPNDQYEKYKQLAKDTDPKHPKILLHEFKNACDIEVSTLAPIDESKWPETLHLWTDYCLAHISYYDKLDNAEKRNKLIEHYALKDPDSPNLWLISSLVKLANFYKLENRSYQDIKDSIEDLEALELRLETSKRKIRNVNLLNLVAQKIRLCGLAYQQSFRLDSFDENIKKFFHIFENCYFTSSIDTHITNVLDTGIYVQSLWSRVTNKIAASNVCPSSDLLKCLYLCALRERIPHNEIREVTE